MKRELKAQLAMCVVWEAGSSGQKSSLARARFVSSNLSAAGTAGRAQRWVLGAKKQGTPQATKPTTCPGWASLHDHGHTALMHKHLCSSALLTGTGPQWSGTCS